MQIVKSRCAGAPNTYTRRRSQSYADGREMSRPGVYISRTKVGRVGYYRSRVNSNE